MSEICDPSILCSEILNILFHLPGNKEYFLILHNVGCKSRRGASNENPQLMFLMDICCLSQNVHVHFIEATVFAV